MVHGHIKNSINFKRIHIRCKIQCSMLCMCVRNAVLDWVHIICCVVIRFVLYVRSFILDNMYSHML